jgi:Protein of unknown function (DUF3037)
MPAEGAKRPEAMAEESHLKSCSYSLVRYVPDTEREEFLNIGLFLHSAEEQFLDCLFTDDFRRVKRFHPEADLGLLRDLQSHFEQQIQEHENDLAGYLRDMQESLSNLIQLTPPRPMLAAEPQAQIQQLFERFVGKRLADFPAADTRMRIKQRLAAALRRAMVYDHPLFEKHIPAERWTEKGDPFHFDFGYRPRLARGKPNGHVKLIHSLSLHRDNETAHVLSNTLRYVRRKEPAELTAVIEGWPASADKVAGHSYRLLMDAEVTLRPLSEVDEFVSSVGKELLLSEIGP